jgi:hypothetical protein
MTYKAQLPAHVLIVLGKACTNSTDVKRYGCCYSLRLELLLLGRYYVQGMQNTVVQ